jgi:hypothetical protein
MGTAVSLSQGTSASDDKAIRDILVNALATMRGPELDVLHGQYQVDLAGILGISRIADGKSTQCCIWRCHAGRGCRKRQARRLIRSRTPGVDRAAHPRVEGCV